MGDLISCVATTREEDHRSKRTKQLYGGSEESLDILGLFPTERRSRLASSRHRTHSGSGGHLVDRATLSRIFISKRYGCTANASLELQWAALRVLLRERINLRHLAVMLHQRDEYIQLYLAWAGYPRSTLHLRSAMCEGKGLEAQAYYLDILLAADPYLPLNSEWYTKEISSIPPQCYASLMMSQRRRGRADVVKNWLEKWHAEYIAAPPELAVLCRTNIRKYLGQTKSIIPCVSHFLYAKILPQPLIDYVFLYAEGIYFFTSDRLDIDIAFFKNGK